MADMLRDDVEGMPEDKTVRDVLQGKAVRWAVVSVFGLLMVAIIYLVGIRPTINAPDVEVAQVEQPDIVTPAEGTTEVEAPNLPVGVPGPGVVIVEPESPPPVPEPPQMPQLPSIVTPAQAATPTPAPTPPLSPIPGLTGTGANPMEVDAGVGTGAGITAMEAEIIETRSRRALDSLNAPTAINMESYPAAPAGPEALSLPIEESLLVSSRPRDVPTGTMIPGIMINGVSAGLADHDVRPILFAVRVPRPVFDGLGETVAIPRGTVARGVVTGVGDSRLYGRVMALRFPDGREVAVEGELGMPDGTVGVEGRRDPRQWLQRAAGLAGLSLQTTAQIYAAQREYEQQMDLWRYQVDAARANWGGGAGTSYVPPPPPAPPPELEEAVAEGVLGASGTELEAWARTNDYTINTAPGILVSVVLHAPVGPSAIGAQAHLTGRR